MCMLGIRCRFICFSPSTHRPPPALRSSSPPRHPPPLCAACGPQKRQAIAKQLLSSTQVLGRGTGVGATRIGGLGAGGGLGSTMASAVKGAAPGSGGRLAAPIASNYIVYRHLQVILNPKAHRALLGRCSAIPALSSKALRAVPACCTGSKPVGWTQRPHDSDEHTPTGQG